jgi:two-component system chemotaxis response regulator CheY
MLALIIDDSRAVRAFIRPILHDLGFQTLEAANGQEALDLVAQYPDIRVILVDWNMPVMDGLQFIRAVRADRNHDDIRIVMVTTETESEQMNRAINAGANEYVMKPFTRDVLVAKLTLMDVFAE